MGRVHVGPRAGDVPQPVDDGVLHLEGGEAAVGERRVLDVGVHGEGEPRREELLPGHLGGARVEAVGVDRGEARDLAVDAHGGGEPQHRAPPLGGRTLEAGSAHLGLHLGEAVLLQFLAQGLLHPRRASRKVDVASRVFSARRLLKNCCAPRMLCRRSLGGSPTYLVCLAPSLAGLLAFGAARDVFQQPPGGRWSAPRADIRFAMPVSFGFYEFIGRSAADGKESVSPRPRGRLPPSAPGSEGARGIRAHAVRASEASEFMRPPSDWRAVREPRGVFSFPRLFFGRAKKAGLGAGGESPRGPSETVRAPETTPRKVRWRGSARRRRAGR